MIAPDDIVRRLRAREREYRGTLLERVFADAADEIVRLRAGLDATAEFCAGYELALSVAEMDGQKQGQRT